MFLFDDDLPFQAVVPAPDAMRLTEVEPTDGSNDEWTLAALEEAYQRAVESAESAEALIEQSEPLHRRPDQTTPAEIATAARHSAPTAEDAIGAPASHLDPQHVLEALLFVGGDPLTGRRLADLLGGDHMHARIEELIVGLNARYADQCRPYLVVLGEGGYRLALRPEFEVVRNRVYGVGPRDVRLSQDALEVLALVAYQQPVSRAALEATGKANVAGHIRQLLRLELVALERGDGGKDDVTYRTTSRFLQLFALERLEDLPQPEDLMFR